MSIFEEIGKKISDTGQTVISGTKAMMEVSKLNGKIDDNNREIDRLFREIGQSYYMEHKDDENSDFIDIFRRIDDLKSQIKVNDDRIKLIKDSRYCPKCGAFIDMSTLSCNKCGESIELYGVEVSENSSFASCYNCGTSVLEKDAYCRKCGTRLAPFASQNDERLFISHKMCPNCGAEVSVEDCFCQNCGVKLELSQNAARDSRKLCPSCGSEVSEEDKFCKDCGTKISL